MTTINLDNATTYPHVVTHKSAIVWTKPTWSDGWTVRPDLHPIQSKWVSGPDHSTATLHYRYGNVRLPGASASATYTPITARGYYVLIAWGTDDGNPLYWLGYANSPITSEHHPARSGLPAAGVQAVPCFGLIRVLRQAWITTTVHEDPDDMATEPRRAGPGGVFNRHQRPNRSAAKESIGDGLDGYVFTNPDTDGQWWSSRDIIEHLVAFHLPTPQQVAVSGAIPWAVNNPTAIPNWDRPVIPTDGKSVGDVIAELLDPSRGLNFAIGANSTFVGATTPPTINAVAVNVFTHLASNLSLSPFGNLPANANQIDITATDDPQTEIDVTEDESEVVDQVVVRGPHEIGIGTFYHGQQIENDWLSADETAYVEDPEDATDWATMKQFEQREVNDRVRSRGKLAKVFRDFRVLADWDGQVGDTGGFEPLFVPSESDDEPPVITPYVPYLAGVELMEELPLYREIDYSGDVSAVDEADGKTLMPPLVALENPETQQLEEFERFGNLSAGFAVRTSTALVFRLEWEPDNERGPRMRVHVHGAPQHAIAGDTFTGNAADLAQLVMGGFDHRTLTATLAMRSDRRMQVALPADSTLAGVDVVRRKVVTLERPTLQLIRIAAGTIVGFDEDGEPKTSNGGVVRDPREELAAFAAMLGQQHLTPRKRVSFETGRRLSGIAVGQLLTSVSTHGSAVNAPIVEVQIETPIGRGGDEDRPIMRFTAAKQRVDVMSLLAPIESDQEEAAE